MLDNRRHIVVNEPESDVALKYFNIADRIKYYTQNKQRVLLFASEYQKEGVTTIATNVAIALARRGANVVYLDANLDDPTIHDTFHVQLRSGITDAIATDKSILSVTYDTPVYGLSMIHVGLQTSIGNEVFLSSKFKYIIGTLRNKFDYCIIDAGMRMYDAANVDATKEAIDAAVIVKNKERHIVQSNELASRLEESGIEILGVVNNFDES
ncbi:MULTISPECIES: tyrosine-protein kinase family protein [Nosocomiicoccus]|uniref:Capsular biosynthesis protein n=1 Tax=Nosocomiicoccus massiliensis TaxID=1232430 RepID=A0AAF0YIP3_9STAP|nr:MULTISPECIES: hypothetical protein [Nosocomiicoccus]OFL49215.1 hypothetical protein HMPREF2767_06615 [Nosocomiicoccus sp. HMSC067E10]WOS96135.1 hypothetical protein CJ229_008635 [Nosocomiicoccus massiliensis]